MIDHCFSKGKQHIQRIIPSGLLELSFFTSDLPAALNGKATYSAQSTLVGQQTEFVDLVIEKSLSLFSVTFKAEGAALFFNLPLNETENLYLPLKDLIKGGHELEEKLASKPIFEDKIRMIEKTLLSTLEHNTGNHFDKRIKGIMDEIDNHKGNSKISELSSQAFLSKKQFERNFKSNIGISPKKFLRIIRFQHAIQSWQQSPLKLTELAYKCGYYDQSHMIHEFKSLSGHSPRELLTNDNPPYSDYFN